MDRGAQPKLIHRDMASSLVHPLGIGRILSLGLAVRVGISYPSFFALRTLGLNVDVSEHQRMGFHSLLSPPFWSAIAASRCITIFICDFNCSTSAVICLQVDLVSQTSSSLSWY